MIGPGRHGLVTALDIGTTKMACFIARIDGDSRIRVIGIGHQVSRGLKAGAIVDMEAVEQSICATVDAAERMAGETVRAAYLNISAGSPASALVSGESSVTGDQIGDSDLREAMDRARILELAAGREVIHVLPTGYSVDGARGIREPRGMFGDRLAVDLHVITAQPGAARNIKVCAARGHLEIAGLVVSPYASGLACLVEDEMDLGVTCIDMGGGTTSIAVFSENSLVFADVIPVGGNHVTSDIARGLSTPMAHAERLKTLHGSAIAGPSDEREIIDIPLIGDVDREGANHVPRSFLVNIIQPRIEETFELVRDRLKKAGIERLAGRRVVLTGGASQLQGARETAALVLEKQVRIGRPLRLSGLAESTGGPAFSTCAGLLSYAARTPLPAPWEVGAHLGGGTVSRIGRWLRENF